MPTTSKVTKEVAQKEFKDWLVNHRRIRPRLMDEKNPDTTEAIENVVGAIQDGIFSINSESGEITQRLMFPIGEGITDEPIESITFKTRMPATAFDASRKFKNQDENTKMRSAISSLGGIGLAFVAKMEMQDIITTSDLVYFYMLG